MIELPGPGASPLLRATLARIDHQDEIVAPMGRGAFPTIDALAAHFCLAQPAWLRLVSMNVLSRSRLVRDLARTRLERGDRVGSWRVHAKGPDEVVFGEDLGFMRYRFGLRWSRAGGVDELRAVTAIELRSWLGRLYFRVVRLVHERFVRCAVRNAVEALSEVRAPGGAPGRATRHRASGTSSGDGS
jgi:hypothetical protein